MTTKIEWVQNSDGSQGKSWNPVTGCTKVSAGCKNCFAERIANRFWGKRKFTDVICHEDRLDMPFKWKKPQRVFVNSMSDLFHEAVPIDFIAAVWLRMIATPQHTYMILTKRAERMAEVVSQLFRDLFSCESHVPANIWLGVSAEDQPTANKRVPWLQRTLAAVRFVSCEPLLGPIDLYNAAGIRSTGESVRKLASQFSFFYDRGIDWVIVGGESGHGARPMDVEWARSIRDQCRQAGVKFFMKQLGGHPNKRHLLEDIPEDLRIREFP